MFAFAHEQSNLRKTITQAYRRPETEIISDLLQQIQMTEHEQQNIRALARELVIQVRQNRRKASGVDALMHQFSLSSNEGIALMCLAEALLRIPDKATRYKLIQDKLAHGNWQQHLNQSPSLFVNAAAWGLLISGKLSQENNNDNLMAALNRLISRGGAPLILQGVNYAIKLLGNQFVAGQTIEEALIKSAKRESMGYRFSFDMLGEAAMTAADAQRYYQDYVQAIHAIGQQSAGRGVYDGNGISVKLSALHPRYSRFQYHQVMAELLPRLKSLFLLAKQYNIGLNIDAEEANRLDLSLDLITAIISDPDLKDFKGIGFVVQAYQKRCPYVIDYLIEVARQHGQRLMIRLVKGAYWDAEVKWTQIEGLENYPVYTRKAYTDLAYLVCAEKLLKAQDAVFPQFATHNAYTLAAVNELGKGKEFEFQCLYGMGETLYDQVLSTKNLGRRVRVYAPVGTHETLLAYLVRRLLENGANSSFVNRIIDKNVSIDELLQSPIDIAVSYQGTSHAALPLPENLYGNGRKNSQGLDFSNELTLQNLQNGLNEAIEQTIHAVSELAVPDQPIAVQTVHNPADHTDQIGTVQFSRPEVVEAVIRAAKQAETIWSAKSMQDRADCLRRFADMLEQKKIQFIALAVRESGKTLANAVAEIREAVDFCRYYANQAEYELGNQAQPLGTIVTISPWNFPLAIFIGQMVAALVVGNVVVSKPAEQTNLIAWYAVKLLHQAGVPKEALQLILGAGEIGAALTANPHINGVIFTGSTEVARLINQNLAKRSDQPILIAETGGQNAMIVDSTALAEQVCTDVLQSAFDSAGQRCSALRILCIQNDVADSVLTMIKGAMNEMQLGDPRQFHTDIGPVIDLEAQQRLQQHIQNIKPIARQVHELALPANLNGTFVAPILIELNDLSELKHEVFGPVLHVIRYAADQLDQLIKQINAQDYALTHGIHSRIDQFIDDISQRIEAGNIYVNRNIVGAVVGVQPFGGHAKSGTGPKAGGPFYLQRLVQQKQWQLPSFTDQPERDEVALQQLLQKIAQMDLSQQDQTIINHVVEETRTRQLRSAKALLKGTTGEKNILSWQAPQHVGLYGGILISSLSALIKLVAMGSQMVVTMEHPLVSWQPQLQTWLRVVEALPTANISHMIALEPLPPAIKKQLAQRHGALINVLVAEKEIDVLPLFEEISISINTSAAGGNASLMAMSEI